MDNGYDITQARLHRKTLCYSRVRGNAETLDQIVATLPQVLGCADSSMIHGIIQQPRFCHHTISRKPFLRMSLRHDHRSLGLENCLGEKLPLQALQFVSLGRGQGYVFYLILRMRNGGEVERL